MTERAYFSSISARDLKKTATCCSTISIRRIRRVLQPSLMLTLHEAILCLILSANNGREP